MKCGKCGINIAESTPHTILIEPVMNHRLKRQVDTKWRFFCDSICLLNYLRGKDQEDIEPEVKKESGYVTVAPEEIQQLIDTGVSCKGQAVIASQ